MLTMKINTMRSMVLERTFHVGVFVGERETIFKKGVTKGRRNKIQVRAGSAAKKSSLIFHDVFNASEHER